MPAQCWTSLHCTYIKGLCLCIGIISFPAGWDNEEVNIWNKLGFCSCCHCIFWLHNFGLPGLYIGHQEVEIPGRACLYEPQLHVSGRDQPWLYGWHHVHGRVKEVRWTPACHADATWTSGWQVRDNGLESSWHLPPDFRYSEYSQPANMSSQSPFRTGPQVQHNFQLWGRWQKLPCLLPWGVHTIVLNANYNQ